MARCAVLVPSPYAYQKARWLVPARLHANKPELLMALERPEIPLHTNGSERDIRCQVIKRKLGGGTHSDVGRDCGDACLGLMRTCAKLGIGLWGHLGDRLGAAGRPGPNSPILSATAASQPDVSRPGFCPAHRNVG